MPQKRAIASLVSRLSFYMREEQAVFRAETLLPEPETLAAVLTCGGREVRAPAAERFEIALPLKEIANGTHKASLTLLKEGKEVARADADLVKRPPREHATRINRFSRALVVTETPIFRSRRLRVAGASGHARLPVTCACGGIHRSAEARFRDTRYLSEGIKGRSTATGGNRCF